MKESTRIAIALVLAIAIGMILRAAGGQSTVDAAQALGIVGNLWISAIRMTVIPLIVSLLITAICSTAGQAIGRLGVRTIVTFVALSVIMAVVMIPLLMLAFSAMPTGTPSGATDTALVADIAKSSASLGVGAWLSSLIPQNPIAAAVNGAMLQLVIFTVLFALALAKLDEGVRAPVVAFFRGVGDAMLLLVRWILWLAPIGVFCLALPLAATQGDQLIGAFGLYVLVYSLACIAGALLLSVVVAAATRYRIMDFTRALLPAQIVALSTSSSVATLPTLVQSAETLGLPQRVTGFVLPLAVSTFKVAAPVSWTSAALFVSHFYHVPLGVNGILTIAFAAMFLSIGVPGVPRGAFIMLAPLFEAVGLPIQGIGLLIAVDVLPDVFATMLNVSGYYASATIVSSKTSIAGQVEEFSS